MPKSTAEHGYVLVELMDSVDDPTNDNQSIYHIAVSYEGLDPSWVGDVLLRAARAYGVHHEEE